MKFNKFISITVVSSIIYFVLNFYLNDFILYIVGGVIGGALNVIFQINSSIIVFTVWLSLLIGFTVLCYFIRNKFLKICLLILIAMLLYLVDALLYEILGDITNKEKRHLHISLAILFKSIILSFAIIVGKKKLLQRHP